MRTAATLRDRRAGGCYCDRDWPMGDGHTPYCRSRTEAEAKAVTILERFVYAGEPVIIRFRCPCGMSTFARAVDVESGLVKSCGHERACSILPLLMERIKGWA